MKSKYRHIIISRTDSIGDVVLTLPVAGVIKKYYPDARITFLGRSYTQAVVESSIYIDAFMEKETFLSEGIKTLYLQPDTMIHVFPDIAIARKAQQLSIPIRIGTTGRFYHWITCNKLVAFSRKRSALHEAQLNLHLLKPLGISNQCSLKEIPDFYGLNKVPLLDNTFRNLLSPGKYHLIVHPKSQGSAREWPMEHYIQLIQMLDPKRYQIFVSGTEPERQYLQPLLQAVGHQVVDITGRMSLSQFMAFITHCDGLLACSTGPLHLAAALGVDAIGLYASERPIHPARWAPLGRRAQVLVAKQGSELDTISPERVKATLEQRLESRKK